MEGINIRNMFNIYGKKMKLIGFLSAILFLLQTNAALAQRGVNRQFYDYGRKAHFGFMIGTNFSNFKYDFSDDWYAPHMEDSFHTVRVQRSPGITLGAVSDFHIGEYFDIRFIPTLVLTQRNIMYLMPNTNGFEMKKEVESAIIEAPLLVKFKSARHVNTRIYVIGGVKYGYDLSSDAKANKNPADPKVTLIPHNYSYEFGGGFDFYFKFFKFSPEVKLSKGINNVLNPEEHIYSRIFDRFRSNFIYFSLYFEG